MQTSPQQNWRLRQDLVTDDWEGYHRLIPESQNSSPAKTRPSPSNKKMTNVAFVFARFRRRTKVVAKAVEMSLATN
jgi:IS1 family transposase